MALLDQMPTVEEMMVALSSPVVPDGEAPTERELLLDEVSTDDMIRQMFEKIMAPPAIS